MPERPQRPRREVLAFRDWLMSLAAAAADDSRIK
jgi:hypothetical protein